MLKRILVVDDEEEIRRLLIFTLKAEGYTTFEASSGAEAIEMIASEEPDLVVLDVMMPHMDGWEVLKQLREQGTRASTRILLLTARRTENDFVMGWKLGVDEYATKPFDPDELVTLIEQTLAASKDQLQLKRLKEMEKANLLSRVEALFSGQ